MGRLWRQTLPQNRKIPVIASGLHGVIQDAGTADRLDEQTGDQGGKGRQGGVKVAVSQPGTLGHGYFSGAVQEQKDEPVNQHHQLDDERRKMQPFEKQEKL